MRNLLYMITNMKTGYFYIGVHRTENIDDGYMGSGSGIIQDIKEFGKDSFTKTILAEFDCIDDAYIAEAEIVTKDFIKFKNVLNRKPGGKFAGCGWEAAHNARKEHDWLKGRSYSEIFGSTRAEELKKIRRLNCGWVGADHSGSNNGNFGNRWNDEQRAKMSKRVKGVSTQSFWATDGSQNMKLRNGQSIPEGWRRGRTPTTAMLESLQEGRKLRHKSATNT